MGQKVIFNCHGLSYTIFRVRAFEVLYLGTHSEFNYIICKHLFHKRKIFAPQICQARCYMGKNVILKCLQLSHTIFGVRAFEVLHLETDPEFN